MLNGFAEEDKAKMLGMIEAMQTRDRCEMTNAATGHTTTERRPNDDQTLTMEIFIRSKQLENV